MLHLFHFDLTPQNVALWLTVAAALLAALGKAVKTGVVFGWVVPKKWIPRLTMFVGFVGAVVTSFLSDHDLGKAVAMSIIGLVSGGIPTMVHEAVWGGARYAALPAAPTNGATDLGDRPTPKN